MIKEARVCKKLTVGKRRSDYYRVFRSKPPQKKRKDGKYDAPMAVSRHVHIVGTVVRNKLRWECGHQYQSIEMKTNRREANRAQSGFLRVRHRPAASSSCMGKSRWHGTASNQPTPTGFVAFPLPERRISLVHHRIATPVRFMHPTFFLRHVSDLFPDIPPPHLRSPSPPLPLGSPSIHPLTWNI